MWSVVRMKASVDRLAVGPLDPALDRHAGPERRGDLVRRVAGLDLVGDDGVGVVAPPAGPIVVEPVAADLLEDVVGGRAEDEQVPLAGRDGDLERAVVPAGHDGLPAREHVVAARADRDELDARRRPAGGRSPASVTLPRIRTPRRSLMSWRRLDRPLGPLELVLLDQVRLAVGGEGAERYSSRRRSGSSMNRPSASARNLAVKIAAGVLVLDQGRGRDDGVRGSAGRCRRPGHGPR